MKSEFLFSSGTSTSRVDLAGLILRLVAGGSMLYGHGLAKFQKVIAGGDIEFVNFMGMGMKTTYTLVMFAEFICAVLLVIGLFTRIALIPLVITMAYVVFVVHKADEFGSKELPLIYLAAFFALFLLGPGKYSLDRMIRSRKNTV